VVALELEPKEILEVQVVVDLLNLLHKMLEVLETLLLLVPLKEVMVDKEPTVVVTQEAAEVAAVQLL
tara:strand:- start:71 stop:271 length:201 start_codon:yes stop_codon:yes gene_type:complete